MKYEQKTDDSQRNYHGSYATYPTDADGNYVCYFNRLYPADKIQPSDFRYIFKELAKLAEHTLEPGSGTIADLTKLGELMIDPENTPQGDPTDDLSNSNIPAGYTYWAQFLDHDISAGTDRFREFDITKTDFAPLAPDDVEDEIIKNQRIPFFDLDSVYGDGAGAFSPDMSLLYGFDEDPLKLKLGTNDPLPPNSALPIDSLTALESEGSIRRDLPRGLDQEPQVTDDDKTLAVLGDERNDENLLLAQFHLAHLKFHNRVVDVLRKRDPKMGEQELFQKARQETTFHYQWLIVNDFLNKILAPGTKDAALDEERTIFETHQSEGVFMPLEFAGAAYRFGHSMVRNKYDFNRNFGRAQNSVPILPLSGFELLFAFTGKGVKKGLLDGSPPPGFTTHLPQNWIIEWNRFFDVTGNEADEDGAPIKDRFTRKIDTKLAEDLTDPGMQNRDFSLLREDEQTQVQELTTVDVFNKIMKHLAVRNLLRGYLLSLPTGQAVATAAGVAVLNSAQIMQGNSAELNELLEESGFLEKTPLWFYILKEAESTQNGDRLGELGSWIVGRTFIGLLKNDENSYIAHSWTPAQGVVQQETETEFVGIMDFLRFAEVA